MALVAGMLAPRAYLLYGARAALIDSDEAITGLMARHILQGHLPIWLYGISYQGSLEAFSAAALFAFFGASPLVLKIESLCWFAGFLVAHYHLAREVAGPRTAQISTFVAAISPAFLMVWSLAVVGTYMSLLCLGTVGLFLAARIITAGPAPLRLAALGFVLGLAWWTFPLAIAYIVPIAAVLGLRRRALIGRRGAVLLTLAFTAGSLPFWPYNLTHGFASLFVRSQIEHPTASIAQGTWGFVSRAIPILLGTRLSHGPDVFPAGSVVALLSCVGAGAMALRRYLSAGNIGASATVRELVLTTAAWIVFLYIASGFGYNADEPRYLIPLYSVLYILVLLGFQPRHQLAVAGILLTINIVGTLQPRVTLTTPLNPEPNGELIAFLKQHGVRHAFAPYWVAYRLTFESGEEIISSPPRYDLVRYGPYLSDVEADPARAYVQLDAKRYAGLQNLMRPPSSYAVTRVGHFEVFLPPNPAPSADLGRPQP